MAGVCLVCASRQVDVIVNRSDERRRRGGGGAPIHDPKGNLITDLREVGQDLVTCVAVPRATRCSAVGSPHCVAWAGMHRLMPKTRKVMPTTTSMATARLHANVLCNKGGSSKAGASWEGSGCAWLCSPLHMCALECVV